MPNDAPAIEMLPRPDDGRVFTHSAKVRLGDVDRRGRLRLDSTARYMQDAATEDANEAQLDRRFGWLVRRTLIEVTEPAMLGESIAVSTWCAGIGRAWAERRTQVVGERGAHIDAVSLWVQVDVETGAPARIAADFLDAYSATSGGRTISARLSLSVPESVGSVGSVVGTWYVRRTDLDPFGHVNNAATWAFLEEHAALDGTDRRGRAELEYLHPIEGQTHPDVAIEESGDRLDAWLIAKGTVAACARWTPTRGPLLVNAT